MTKATERVPSQAGAAKRHHYWLREDFDHLMGVLPAADHEFPNDRNTSSSLFYPKTTEGAFRELRLRGLQCDEATLLRLVEQQVVTPAGEPAALQWSKHDIDAAAERLYENGDRNPWTQFCWVGNLRYGQCVKAYRVASARFGLPFSMDFDPLGLVTVIEPASSPDEYARVRFFPKGTILEPQEDSD